jgi:hypothetical protein
MLSETRPIDGLTPNEQAMIRNQVKQNFAAACEEPLASAGYEVVGSYYTDRNSNALDPETTTTNEDCVMRVDLITLSGDELKLMTGSRNNLNAGLFGEEAARTLRRHEENLKRLNRPMTYPTTLEITDRSSLMIFSSMDEQFIFLIEVDTKSHNNLRFTRAQLNGVTSLLAREIPGTDNASMTTEQIRAEIEKAMRTE